MASLSEYQRKYLQRLAVNAIDHNEVKRWGKRPVAIMLSLNQQGLVDCTSFDGEDQINPALCEDEFWWAITPLGLQAIGKA